MILPDFPENSGYRPIDKRRRLWPRWCLRLHPGCLGLALPGFLVSAIISVGAHAEFNDCDWHLSTQAAEYDEQTQEEIETELVRELAIKLRQFDRCLEQDAAEPRTIGDDSAADGTQAQTAGSAGHQQNPADEQAQAPSVADVATPAGNAPSRSGAGAVTGTSANRQDTEEGFRQATQQSTPITANRAMEAAAPNDAALPGAQRERTRPRVVEDDVARILREAAEKESDPTRKAALWQEYDNYVKNL